MSLKLGELLVAEGWITPPELQEALRAQRIFGGSLGTHLLQLGLVNEAELGRALERVHGLPAAGRSDLLGAPPEVVALLPADFVRRHRAVPFRVEGDALWLALQNPGDALALHEAAFLTGCRIVPHVAAEAVLRDALAALLRLDADGRAAGPVRSTPAGRARPEGASGLPAGTGHAGAPEQAAPGPSEAVDEESPTSGLRDPSSEEERRDGAGSDRPASALAVLGRRLAAARSRDDVLAAALDDLASRFPRAAVFALRGQTAVLWRAVGLPPSPHPVAVPLDESSVLWFHDDESAVRFGPVAASSSNQDLCTLLGGRIPRVALVVPVQVRQRTVAVLYADDPEGHAPPPDVARVRRVAALLSWALEAVILRGKILRESGA